MPKRVLPSVTRRRPPDRYGDFEFRIKRGCGFILMAYAFLCAMASDWSTTAYLPYTNVCLAMAAGAAYELYFYVRALFKETENFDIDNKLLASFTLTGVGFVLVIKQAYIEIPVLVLYVLLFIIGAEIAEVGKRKEE